MLFHVFAFVAMLFAFALPSAISAQTFSGGTGTPADPYRITSAADLVTLATNVNADTDNYSGKYFRLTADINLDVAPYNAGSGWTPIGNYNNRFKGVFDGDGKTISGLFINRTADFQGLFGAIDGGTVKNLGLENVNIKGSDSVGGVAGAVPYSSILSNCYATGAVSGNNSVGGAVGWIGSSNVTGIHATGTVYGNNIVGGVVGSVNNNSSITGCAALNPSVKATGANVGRVVGNVYSGTLSGNIAWDGISTNGGSAFPPGDGTNDINGESLTAAQIAGDADGTYGSRFTAANGWTVAVGKLPGLGGAAVDMPAYLFPATVPLDASTLGGTVTISGAAIFGQTLTAGTSGLTSTPSVALGALSYQWKRGGADINGANGATYTALAADVGQTLSVTVTAANCSGSVTSAATGAIGKATNPAAVPTLSYTISDTFPKTVTITPIAGAEYSFDGGMTWGSENTHTSNATEDVSLAIRWAETGVYSASGETSIEINTAEDPNADIAAARTAIGFADDAGEFAGAQEDIADEAAALLDIEAIIQAVLGNSGLGSVDFAITNGVFQAASGGVDGSYTFTVTFTKGGGIPLELDLEYVIVATPIPPEVGEPVIVAVSEALLPEHRSLAQQVLDTIRGVTPPLPGAINAVIVGCDVTFEVSAVGEGLVYQWFKNGAAVFAANAATFTASAVQEGDVYSVSVTNAAGGVTVREVASPEFFHPVVIVDDPASVVVLQAGVATLSVTVNGSGTIYYQWCRVDAATGALDPIPLANTATYNATEPGFYCLVTNNRANRPATSSVVEVVP